MKKNHDSKIDDICPIFGQISHIFGYGPYRTPHIWVVRIPKKLFSLSGMNTSKNSPKVFFQLENTYD